MLKKIVGTIGTRYVVAFLNLALIFINAKALGVEGVGLIGVLMTFVNLIIIACTVLGSSSLVYFMNRYSVKALFSIAYCWSIAVTIFSCLLLQLLGVIPTGYFVTILTLSLLNAFIATNTRFLLGNDRMKAFNVVYLLHGGLLFFALLFFYFVIGEPTVQSYIRGSYWVNFIAFIVSFALILPYLKRKKEPNRPPLRQILKEMFTYGIWVGLDCMMETLTTRLNYLLIQRFGGFGAVGMLDAGTKVSESVWHISKSIGLIAYNSVARMKEEKDQIQITLRLFKVTFFSLLAVMIGILLIPEWVYTDILFSSEFQGIRRIIVMLSFGIVALGSYSIISNYFYGSGRIRYSTYSSIVGFVVLLLSASLLIPSYGVYGAALSSSIAFTVMFFFAIFLFCRTTHTSPLCFFPHKEDWDYLFNKIRRKKQ